MFRGIPHPESWESVDESLLVLAAGACRDQDSLLRVAGFDFDDTLVQRVGDEHMFPTVRATLTDLHLDGFAIVIFTNESLDGHENQGAKLAEKVRRVERFVSAFPFPIHVYMATARDKYRKPHLGVGSDAMWTRMTQDLGEADLEQSFYCGDMVGDTCQFSDGDLWFAKEVGIRFVHPTEMFSPPPANRLGYAPPRWRDDLS